MAEPFLSEIRIVSFDYPPKGWAFCNGQTLPINQNQALFSLLGTTYGGNGQTTFQLPNLQGRTPLHFGPINPLGTAAGETTHTLTLSEMSVHSHALPVSTSLANASIPTGAVLAHPAATVGAVYSSTQIGPRMSPQMLTAVGGGQPHNNMQPYLVLNFCIALVGIFPSRN
ncbi:MAG: phage Tail Collar domain protein [Capsulimonas sp.]|jgi:microcystin-dependent protein|nr:phage Tail Collar domain protein [Capsulimonas sp.]